MGDLEILDRLRDLAPVHAVRKNTDRGELQRELAALTEVVEAGGAHLYLVHILADLDLDPAAADFRAVIFGHTHRPELSRRDGILYLNPSAAGRHRSHLPATVARLDVTQREDGPVLDARIVELANGS